ncbi:GDSL-type esterase/lipase family protein [Salipaludibacillus sp. CF4.18]|uniref:GDSL-type esterase/lipase family protein n=1 Tax=Salipaludibacillus sp. CF4.18 TaxID=3373081 RepID=UPI003EE469AF
MGKLSKIVALSVMVFTLFFGSFVVPSGVSAKTMKHDTLYYVALGDSLAAGYTPTFPGGDPFDDSGYPEYLKTRLEQSNYTTELNNLAVGGNQTTDVLAQLGDRTIISEIQRANIITLNIGANDILQLLLSGASEETIQDATGKTLSNIAQILGTIQAFNEKDANIYIMGYYNPVVLYDIPDFQKELINSIVVEFNMALENLASTMGVHFVPTANLVEKNADSYLTSYDIHLTKEGYEGVGKEFWKSLNKTKGWKQN